MLFLFRYAQTLPMPQQHVTAQQQIAAGSRTNILGKRRAGEAAIEGQETTGRTATDSQLHAPPLVKSSRATPAATAPEAVKSGEQIGRFRARHSDRERRRRRGDQRQERRMGVFPRNRKPGKQGEIPESGKKKGRSGKQSSRRRNTGTERGKATK